MSNNGEASCEDETETKTVHADGTVSVKVDIDPDADEDDIRETALEALSEEYPEIDHVNFVWTPREVYYER